MTTSVAEAWRGLPDLEGPGPLGDRHGQVDFAAAEDCGIVVRNTPGVFGEEVADSAFGYVLNLARGHHMIDAAVRRGEWLKIEGSRCTTRCWAWLAPARSAGP